MKQEEINFNYRKDFNKNDRMTRPGGIFQIICFIILTNQYSKTLLMQTALIFIQIFITDC